MNSNDGTNRKLPEGILEKGESVRANGTYCYRWTDKLQKRHAIYAKTLSELREMEISINRDYLSGIGKNVRCMTINEVYARWCRLKRGLRDRTFQSYKFFYENYVMHTFGRLRIIKVKKSDIRHFYNTLYEQGGYSISTLDNVHTVLHQVFALACEDQEILVNPADGALEELKLVHSGRGVPVKALTLEQQKLFLDFVKRSDTYAHWYPLFSFLLGTGMRIGETFGLRWKDVDLDAKVISVNHNLVYYQHGDGKCKFEITPPKTKAGVRTIPMINSVREALEAEKSYQQEKGIKYRIRIDGNRDFIFLNMNGSVHNQGTVNRAIKRIVRDYNDEVISSGLLQKDQVLLPYFSCHCFRHTFATRMIEAGVNLKVVQTVLGHTDITTTMNIYADVTSRFMNTELSALEEYLES